MLEIGLPGSNLAQFSPSFDTVDSIKLYITPISARSLIYISPDMDLIQAAASWQMKLKSRISLSKYIKLKSLFIS